MSTVKQYILDHRTVFVSVAVILVFVLLGTFIMNKMNSNTLLQRQQRVLDARSQVDASIAQRFSLAQELVPNVEQIDPSGAQALSDAIALYEADVASVENVSDAYNELETALKRVQRSLVGNQPYQQTQQGMQAVRLLNRISDSEAVLVDEMAVYEDAATRLASMSKSFPMNISARKLEIPSYPLFSVRKALQVRP